MYSLELPNGKTIQVPDEVEPQAAFDTYKSAMMAEVEKENKQFMKDANPTAGNSFMDNFTAGVGRGVVDIGRNIGNIAGLVSDEDLEKSDALDQALLDTGGGTVGSLVGESLATAPVGPLGRVLGKAAGVAKNAIPAVRAAASPVGRTGTRAASVLPKSAAAATQGRGAAIPGIKGMRYADDVPVPKNPLAGWQGARQATGQGATVGALTAEPGESRLAGAGQGAALGNLLRIPGKAAGAFTGSRPLLKKQPLGLPTPAELLKAKLKDPRQITMGGPYSGPATMIPQLIAGAASKAQILTGKTAGQKAMQNMRPDANTTIMDMLRNLTVLNAEEN